jgi:hypothetical protein
MDNWALRFACENGRLAAARWLADRFGLSAGDARAADNWAVRSACENGHLAVAQWLVERFGLEGGDIRAEGGYALKLASWNGHLDVARWLVESFDLAASGPQADVLKGRAPPAEFGPTPGEKVCGEGRARAGLRADHEDSRRPG